MNLHPVLYLSKNFMNKIEECVHMTLMPPLLAKVNRGITPE
jgi:hypothetical protein